MLTSTQIQWVNGTDLGTIYSTSTGNIYFLPVTVYDPHPFTGPVTYSLINNHSTFTNLPTGLTLDSATGYIWGTLATDYNDYREEYNLSIQATKTYTTSSEQISIVNTFKLVVRDYDQTNINWVSPSNLGTIEIGSISSLSIQTELLNSTASTTYTLIDNTLSGSGLTFQSDGTITGVASGIPHTYNFTATINVVGVGDFSSNFSITTTATTDTSYTNIYLHPLLKLDQRKYFQDFISNTTIFPSNFIYRPLDSNFGIQTNFRMVLEYGIEKLNLSEYTTALKENFYKRRFTLGDVKTIEAKDSSGTTIYDIVYVDIVDELKGITTPIYVNNLILYPASIENMRKGLESTITPSSNYIKVNKDFQPLFMSTYQQGVLYPPNYIPVLILCYALPKYGQIIVNRINASGVDFKLIDFEIDRIIVQNSLDNASDKYLLLERQSLSGTIPEDSLLYGPDDFEWIFDDKTPITRE